MQRDAAIPDAVRRFVLTRVPSVPFLEAARLLHSNAGATFTAEAIASSLYVTRETAGKLLTQLLEAGIAAPAGEGYRYQPRDAELASALEALFACYRLNLVGITNLVHDATQRSAERFANAFKLKKDP